MIYAWLARALCDCHGSEQDKDVSRGDGGTRGLKKPLVDKRPVVAAVRESKDSDLGGCIL